MTILKQNFGDGKRLKVVLFNNPTQKRFIVYTYVEEKIVDMESFNKLKNAQKRYNKILEEF